MIECISKYNIYKKGSLHFIEFHGADTWCKKMDEYSDSVFIVYFHRESKNIYNVYVELSGVHLIGYNRINAANKNKLEEYINSIKMTLAENYNNNINEVNEDLIASRHPIYKIKNYELKKIENDRYRLITCKRNVVLNKRIDSRNKDIQLYIQVIQYDYKFKSSYYCYVEIPEKHELIYFKVTANSEQELFKNYCRYYDEAVRRYPILKQYVIN